MNPLKENLELDSTTESLTAAITVPDSSVEHAETSRTWLVALTGIFFVLLQSACTAVIAISGIRVLIGLSSLAAAAGLHKPAWGFHADAIRIPMLSFALLGSLINLYVLWRIRSLRNRPSSQWRARTVTAKQRRGEIFQTTLAILTIVLVAAEWFTHTIVHDVPK